MCGLHIRCLLQGGGDSGGEEAQEEEGGEGVQQEQEQIHLSYQKHRYWQFR